MAQCYIGTSGWAYGHWRGAFYPEGLPAGDRLAYYARHLGSTEINNSFYRLPAAQTVACWRRAVPDTFVFAAKASRYITHMKKLKEPEPGVERYLERMEQLGDRLGPILFQLPPHWHCDPGRLGHFLGILPSGHRYALEFRDRSWLNETVLSLLQHHGAAFCIHDYAGFQSPLEISADFVYIRLHGPDGAYRGNYDTPTLDHWAGAIAHWLRQGLDVYCYFDNDEAGYAAANAQALDRAVQARAPGQTSRS
ncbi:DUF72 domain-containing protein [Thiohalocapsa marina]|uniref:DUF72 domain-containing protein n=1 Tax=Thiohalocapsa marina TaxID=424902 RepID=A0A5M8FMP5_9GAMM|nr:DUF72 domain-containing protein [Thiohalocapsa marina]KAA6186213.1 DUF72 domain-containing protein [Thiohalocapsa marina]